MHDIPNTLYKRVCRSTDCSYHSDQKNDYDITVNGFQGKGISKTIA